MTGQLIFWKLDSSLLDARLKMFIFKNAFFTKVDRFGQVFDSVSFDIIFFELCQKCIIHIYRAYQQEVSPGEESLTSNESEPSHP